MKLSVHTHLAEEHKSVKLELAFFEALKLLTTLAHYKRVITTVAPDNSTVHLEKSTSPLVPPYLVLHYQRGGLFYCAGVRFDHSGLVNGRGQLTSWVAFGKLPDGTPLWDPHLIEWIGNSSLFASVNDPVDLNAALLHTGKTAFDWFIEGNMPAVLHQVTTFTPRP